MISSTLWHIMLNGRTWRVVGALLSTLLVAIGIATGPSLRADTAGTPVAVRSPLASGDFPIAVWLQEPSLASQYKRAGINLYVGLWQGPTDKQLADLKAAGMPVFCEQNATGLQHKDDQTIVGWMQQDEPDNAQPIIDKQTGKETGYGPCVPPATTVAIYRAIKTADPTRPVMLNLGQGVANDAWYGRGSGTSLDDYRTYVNGGDIVSYDIYPVAGLNKPDDLWYVSKGLDRLNGWTGGKKPLWEAMECTNIGGVNKPTPEQVRSEIWMALVHGATGLIYFVHQFKPSFDEAALLHDPTMLAAVTAVNKEIHDLAPVLLSPTQDGAVLATSSDPATAIDTMVKKRGSDTYVFAVGMRNSAVSGTFTVKGLRKAATADVVGEDRTIAVRNGQFTDSFAPYGSHTYRIH